MDQLATVGYGKVNFSNRALSLAAFSVTGGPKGTFERSLCSKVHKKTGKTMVMPASLHPHINGSMYSENVVIPDGTILLLQVSEKFNGSPFLDAGVFIIARAEGAARAVNLRLPAARESALGTQFLALQIHGDMISLEELERVGIKPPPNWVRGFLNKEEVDDAFSFVVMSEERMAKPTTEVVTNVDGENVLLKSRPKRMIRFR